MNEGISVLNTFLIVLCEVSHASSRFDKYAIKKQFTHSNLELSSGQLLQTLHTFF